ncbi:hypothetical protein PAXRUDRAFT_169066 [Paxillus rubicundulus Ve08.2h10]|uniref:Uncharacterized protein n=1 Tax=Paxillus rubicundulus Ve08.2h10 TaxID=930991 RepID=A0A0D0DFW1_9AGAM|nr:hypothetical protein PAXRUDRAFT_169066 [Paxillus rubicundulus Ve08.2h10]
MPYPSNPLDDIRAHSFDREHGLRSGGISRTFGSVLRWAACSSVSRNQRDERLSDGFPLGLLSVVSLLYE